MNPISSIEHGSNINPRGLASFDYETCKVVLTIIYKSPVLAVLFLLFI